LQVEAEDEMEMMEVLYVNQEIVLEYATLRTTLEMPRSNDWKSLAVTILSTQVTLYSGSNSSSIAISPKDFIDEFSAVTIGEGFSGLLQDIIVYGTPLDGVTPPNEAAFLPQCYCRPPSNFTSSGQCSEGDGKISTR
jgi:hypothetical protein